MSFDQKKHNKKNPPFTIRPSDPELIKFLEGFAWGKRTPWIIEAIQEKRGKMGNLSLEKVVEKLETLMDFFEEARLSPEQLQKAPDRETLIEIQRIINGEY